jgi:hypothetical protein
VLATESIAAATTYTHLANIESLKNDNAILDMYQNTGRIGRITDIWYIENPRQFL